MFVLVADLLAPISHLISHQLQRESNKAKLAKAAGGSSTTGKAQVGDRRSKRAPERKAEAGQAGARKKAKKANKAKAKKPRGAGAR